MRCRTCLYPDTKPDLFFDETGQCSACINYAYRPEIGWDKREEELVNLLDRHDGKVLVGSSGGKDSTAIVIKMLELGADVTIVTARTCLLTDIGRKNIDNLSKYAKTIEVVPNMTDRAKLNRIGLETVGDISLPEHWAIFSTPFRIAVDLNIPLVMYGENSQQEYGGPPGSESAKQMTRFWANEYGGYLGMRPSDITDMDMRFYTLPTDNELESGKIEAHFLGAYIPWNSHNNSKIAIDYGMQTFGVPPSEASWWKWENLDCGMTGIHCHFMYLKYGYGRACAQLSVDIRSGLISRSEALSVLKKIDGLFPEVYAGVHIEDVLDHIGMTRARLNALMVQYTRKAA